VNIATLAQKTGFTTSAIRYYEAQGVFSPRYLRRLSNNYRDYADEAVTALLLMKQLQSAGFSLHEIVKLAREVEQSTDLATQVVARLRTKRQEVEAKIADLIQVKEFIDQIIERKLAHRP